MIASTQVFIISWRGQHDNALKIAEELRSGDRKMTVVFSDPDDGMKLEGDFHVLRRPDDRFFGDKFNACLEAFEAETFLLIHADCQTNDWRQLVDKCESTLAAHHSMGIWAPKIDYTGFDLDRTWIADTPIPELKIVGHTDSIVVGLRSAVIERLRKVDYTKNIYGWGIGSMAVAFAYANKMYAVVDQSIHVSHPRPRGYPSRDAAQQRDEFLKQLTMPEQIQLRLLQSHMTLRGAALSKSAAA